MSSQQLVSGDEPVVFIQSEATILSKGHKHKFEVEIADTDEKRATGLMYRTIMAPKKGMLFLFDANRIVNMWMKNTYIPLDIIFIDQKGVILHIAQSTIPQSLDIISSIKPVVSVLELNAGVTKNLNIHIGDKIEHPYFAR